MVVLEFTLRVSLRGWSALKTEGPEAPETETFSPSDDACVLIMFMLIQSSVLAHSWISELRCSKFVFNKKDPSGFPPVELLPVPAVPAVPSPFCWKFERFLLP